MIKVKLATLKNTDFIAAVSALSQSKELPFPTAYNVMKLAKKVDSEIGAVNMFLKTKLEGVMDKQDDKELMAKVNSEVEEFMKGEATIEREAVLLSAINQAALSAKEIHILVDSGLVVDDFETTQGGQNGN